MNRIVEAVNQVPPVTRYLMGAMVLLGLLDRTTINAQMFAWLPSKMVTEPWRLVTSLLYIGPLDWVLMGQLHSVYMFSKMLEEHVYLTTANYLSSLGAAGVILLCLSALGGIRFPGPALVSTLTYLWSRKNPEQRFMILFVDIPASYLFWVQILQVAVFGSRGYLSIIFGLVTGHTIFFAQDTYPLLTGKQLL